MNIINNFIKSFLFIISILVVSCNQYTNYADTQWEEVNTPPWEDPEVYEINREAPRAHFIPYATVQQARSEDKWLSPSVRSLNGVWKFHLAQNPAERPYWFFKNDYDIRQWNDINVPANWELEGFDYPIYTNVKYPHSRTPPIIEGNYNPVGSYKRTFQFLPDGKKKKSFFTLELQVR